MSDLGAVARPPETIKAGRLVLRESEARDRAPFIGLPAPPEAHTYLGGPARLTSWSTIWPGRPSGGRGVSSWVSTGRWSARSSSDEQRSTVARLLRGRPIGYLFLPRACGLGYAAEACAAALDWFDGVLPGEPVVLTTQTATVGSTRLAAKPGFTEVERFHAWDAEQWLGLRPPVTPSV